MKHLFLTILFILSSICLLLSQDTFSIVAVDSVTGEVGSAGASCLDASDIAGGAAIISDIIPGKGAIHTQSFWRPGNQNNARRRMLAGDSPDQIMTWLGNRFNDVDLDSRQRQYGAAAFDSIGSPAAASYTGPNCFDWKGHLVGENYAIQGNILLGPQILDSMEARFLRASGTLADRLMEALQGANVPGADSRCLAEGVSSQSAFLRVAKPGDPEDSLWLDIIVDITPFGEEPIDSVQVRYDEWKRTVGMENNLPNVKVSVFPQPVDGSLFVEMEGFVSGQNLQFEIFDGLGRVLFRQNVYATKTEIPAEALKGIGSGVYYWRLLSDKKRLAGDKLIIVH